MNLKDSKGKELPLHEVEKLARHNIRGSMSIWELIDFYIENISEYELVEWATDENGEFTDG